MKRSRGRKSEAGVTLVELAIVLTMVSIAAMIALPSIVGVMPRISVSNEASVLANEIALARARAISKNNDFHIIFDTANDQYTLRNDTTGKNFAVSAISDKVDLYSVTGLNAANTLVVRPVGTVGRLDSGSYEDLPLGTDAVIALQSNDGLLYKRVVVETTGRIYSERSGDGASWVED